jgi:hypothetical protein
VEAAGRISNAAALYDAVGRIAGKSQRVDPALGFLAWRTFFPSGDRPPPVDLLGAWREHRTWDDPERAAEMYAWIPPGTSRMAARLAEADHLRARGMWRAARDTAFAALDEWDLVADPLPPAWHTPLETFVNLHAHAELVAWARERRTPAERAIALAAAVGGIRQTWYLRTRAQMERQREPRP